MKTMNTRGGLPDAQGSLDNASSLQQVPGVVQPPANKDALSYKDIDEGHGGINQTAAVAQINDVVGTHMHDNSSFVMPWHGRF